MMVEARRDRHTAPMKAAVNASIAVAIAIESIAPVRLNNLIKIKLDENLIKPGGLDGPYWLVFPKEDVKNRVPLQHKILPEIGELIDEYINDYRPILLRRFNTPWLFSGENGGVKTSRTLSLQITDRVFEATGLRLTVHQFRHAAAAIFIKAFPGQYERARQLLGHKNIATTMRFYVALETTFANEAFNDIIKKRLVDGIQQFAPTPDSGDDFIGVCGPGEWFGIIVGLRDETIDGGLEINNASEDTALQSLFSKLGEEPLHRVEPRARVGVKWKAKRGCRSSH